MKKTARFLIKPLIFLILITTFIPPSAVFADSPFSGIWKGVLSVQGTELGLSFENYRASKDEWEQNFVFCFYEKRTIISELTSRSNVNTVIFTHY